MKTFKRGIFLDEQKQRTENSCLVEAGVPAKVIIPLLQHNGAVCEPLVKAGDEVVEGQKIGDSTKFLSVPVHASITGRVTRIDRTDHPCGGEVVSVVIEGGGGGKERGGLGDQEIRKSEDVSAAEVRQMVREAGIAGMGGAVFPTHVKLTPPEGKQISTIVINGCECEPYITTDHRLMLERAPDLISGAKLAAKAVGATRIVIGVESNKKDAIKVLRSVVRTLPVEWVTDDLAVVELNTKYPQGGEKMLIKALLGRAVPSRGLPLDVGVVVLNVSTAIAIHEAVLLGQPLIKRVVTVTGSAVKNPQNLVVRLGTTFQDVLDQCGGVADDTAKVIMGGPMTGLAIANLNVPVVKATSCILALKKQNAATYEESDCIRCGRCVKACPIGLLPNFLAEAVKLKNWGRLEELNLADCIECGCCAYVCPSRIFLVQYFKAGKKELQLRSAVCR